MNNDQRMMRSGRTEIRFKFMLAVWMLLAASRGLGGDTGRGGYAGSFLRIGLGARAMAMGGGSAAILNDAYSAYYNPAGLGYLNKR
jgi:hypothetical protein